jgi:hypothetical protein
MKTLLLLPLLLMFISPGQKPAASQESSSVVVLGFKCSRTRQTVETPDTSRAAPAREVIPANKNYARNARVNNPVGAKDPNEDTIDARSAELEKIEQQSRTPTTKPVDGYAYRVRLQNTSTKVIEILFWEYQFIDPSNPGTMARRQFLCGVNVKANKEKEVQAFSLSGPTDVVSVGGLANGSGSVFQENVVINRVEYADGSIWQRKDWNAAEIKLTYQHAVARPWNPGEMCRGL